MNPLPKPPKFITPLWIIFLFFSFTEVALGYVVFKTTGGVQLALTCFVIGFPTFIAIWFFALLWARPGHLYSPKDYGSDESFIKGLVETKKVRGDLWNLETEIEQRISKRLGSEQFAEKLSSLDSEQIKQALKDTAADISTEIKETTFVDISFTLVSLELKDKALPVRAYKSFHDFLTDIYYIMEGAVEAYTYGASWVLRDKKNGKIFKSAGMLAGIEPGIRVDDSRTLEEVGIKAGMSLEVVALISDKKILPPNLSMYNQ